MINVSSCVKTHAMFKLFSFWHSPQSKKKKCCTTPLKIMTDNQNINNTSMKHVQQEHFLYKTAITMYSDWNVSENFVFFLFVCSSFFLPAWHFKVDERWIKASVVEKLSVDKRISRCCISFHAWIQWIYLTRLFLVFECDYERVTKQKKKSLRNLFPKLLS